MNSDSETLADERRRVLFARALRNLQHAQDLVGYAAQELSPIDGHGACELWDETNRLYDLIKDHWHKVNNLRVSQTQPTASAVAGGAQ